VLPTSHRETRGLSAHQRTILALTATGLTSIGASDRLGIPVDEARAEIRDIIRSLGARSKLEAVVLALRHGLIELPSDGRADQRAIPA
jgi:DNA-binding CsgD family transcriptional regulator